MLLADGDAPERRARLLLDDEAADALVGAGRERDERRPLAVGDPHLRAVDHVLVAVARGLARDVARVAAGVGLGQREAAAQLAGGHARAATAASARRCRGA